MQLTTHLHFNGQCEAAFKFYEACLGGRVTLMMTYRDSPLGESIPPAYRDKIIHASFALGDQRLTGADAMPEQYQKPQGFSILLNLASAAEADRVFAALAEGGGVQMPIGKTFWAERFGMLVDRFGVPWMVNCETAS